MQIVQINSSEKEVVSKKYLEITNCGLCAEMTEPIEVNKPKGRRDYHFVYIIEGTMHFEFDGKRIDIGAGNLVIFKPGEAQIYGSYEDDVVSYYWAHFSGSGVRDILADCGLDSKHYYFIDVDAGICKAVNMLIKEYTYGEYCYVTKCNSLFIMLLSEMARLTDEAIKYDGKYEVLLPAIKAMEQNYNVWYKNEEYAEMCGISKYHFIHLFTECKGCSPSKYKSGILMKKATELLAISDISMNEIADMLGFEDALYFSKKFKTDYGMSPSQYRQKYGK